MMKSYFSKLKKTGFSLVEMIVYIGIFMVVSVASVGFLFSLEDLIGQYRLETALYRSGSSVMEQVLLAVRQADLVDTLNTVEDSASTGKLTVENVSTSTSFTLDAGSLNLAINGVDYGDLTGEVVTVNGFTVYYYPTADGRQFVRVKLDLTATLNASFSKSMTFYGGAVIRGAL
jgi:type II secretory pathway pseudopilin PulG